jgi:hypothetical protein
VLGALGWVPARGAHSAIVVRVIEFTVTVWAPEIPVAGRHTPPAFAEAALFSGLWHSQKSSGERFAAVRTRAAVRSVWSAAIATRQVSHKCRFALTTDFWMSLSQCFHSVPMPGLNFSSSQDRSRSPQKLQKYECC